MGCRLREITCKPHSWQRAHIQSIRRAPTLSCGKANSLIRKQAHGMKRPFTRQMPTFTTHRGYANEDLDELSPHA